MANNKTTAAKSNSKKSCGTKACSGKSNNKTTAKAKSAENAEK